MAESVAFDPNSVTLGEMDAAEQASGLGMSDLLKSRTRQLMLGVFVTQLRSSGQAPKWSDLRDLRIVDASSSLSGSEPDSPGPR